MASKRAQNNHIVSTCTSKRIKSGNFDVFFYMRVLPQIIKKSQNLKLLSFYFQAHYRTLLLLLWLCLYTYLKKSDFAFLAVIPKKWPRPLNFEHIKSDDAGIYFGIKSQFLNPLLKGFLSIILLWDSRHLAKIWVFTPLPPPKALAF